MHVSQRNQCRDSKKYSFMKIEYFKCLQINLFGSLTQYGVRDYRRSMYFPFIATLLTHRALVTRKRFPKGHLVRWNICLSICLNIWRHLRLRVIYIPLKLGNERENISVWNISRGWEFILIFIFEKIDFSRKEAIFLKDRVSPVLPRLHTKIKKIFPFWPNGKKNILQ